MSREIATSRPRGAPSSSPSGDTSTSHHFGVPRAVGPNASKRTLRPSRAAATASTIRPASAPGHSVVQGRSRRLSISSISSTRRPFWLTLMTLPSVSRTLMQSGLAASTLRMRASRSRIVSLRRARAAAAATVLASAWMKSMSCRSKSPVSGLSASSTPKRSPPSATSTFSARQTPCSASTAGVRKRPSSARWLEITGSPVRKA